MHGYATLLQELALQEQQLQFTAFSSGDALKLGLHLADWAAALGVHVVIAAG